MELCFDFQSVGSLCWKKNFQSRFPWVRTLAWFNWPTSWSSFVQWNIWHTCLQPVVRMLGCCIILHYCNALKNNFSVITGYLRVLCGSYNEATSKHAKWELQVLALLCTSLLPVIVCTCFVYCCIYCSLCLRSFVLFVWAARWCGG